MHKHMAIDLDEAVELTHISEKIIPIIPTSVAPIECLLWSVFSLLLRAKPDDLIEHFIVCINGPDKRTGDPKSGDIKQHFLEELRRLKWYHADRPKISKDMPITVIRAWSRIGHPEAVEMAMPWVHTDAYLLMHDDIIITKHNWLDEVRTKFYGNPNVAIAYAPQLMCALADTASYQDKNLLRFPHLLCCFLVCRKKHTRKNGGNWCGYHIPTPTFRIKERVGNLWEFMEYYKSQNLINNQSPPKAELSYDYVSMEMGAWHFYTCVQNGYEFAALDPTLLVHLGTMSWESDTGKKNRVHRYQQQIDDLEAEIAAHPEYSKLYDKYIKYSSYHKAKYEN